MVARNFMKFLATVAATALLVPSANALPWEVGGLLGIQLPDEELTGAGKESSEFPPTIGARLEVDPSDNWGLFVDGLFSSIGSSKPTGDATMLHGRFGAELEYPDNGAPHAMFVNAGLGMMNVDLDEGESFSRPYWSLGVGTRWFVTETMGLRAEVRGDRTMGDVDDDIVGKTMHQFEILAGVTWTFGKGGEPDTDGDGVNDSKDQCPDTPRGARVDAVGCPKDSDGDGVWDGIDKCPNTPKGATVDARGCPMDSDGDGVYDGIDQCPDTPKGVEVDATGCPADEDGDGVKNELDKCPGTPKGVEVDETGCPKAKPIFTEEKQELILEGVNFEFNSAVLTKESTKILDEVAASLVAWPDVNIEVGGHTDTVGTHEYNMGLSDRRAASVKAYLAGKGVAESRMTSKGYGPDEPVASNDTAEGRAKNRRVELKKR